ncbi:hypothetical protein NESM_000866300 [Novymonas esmeraldas]|uniref:Uncharacterized protein n=1 Tax=Novymonas esmeraldas TaxID=1808958 RepID=A0AAW0F182_9TRYP
MARRTSKASTSAQATVVFGDVDCAPFQFADAEDARVFAEVEQSLVKLQSKPTVDALVTAQRALVGLARYPTVVGVVASRYPLLLSALTQCERGLGIARAASLSVSGMKWDVWCRNAWLTNACAIEDIGDQALATLGALPQQLRSIREGSDGAVMEVWSVLRLLSWALRSSAMGGSVAALLESCDELWQLVEAEVVQAGRHVSLQLVLLDLLSALALHVAVSGALHTRLVALVALLAPLPMPAHLLTAARLYFACAVVRQDGDAADAVAHAHARLREACDGIELRFNGVPPELRAAEWVAGVDVGPAIDVAAQLHRLIRGSSSSSGAATTAVAVDAKAVKAFTAKARELPVSVRAFCIHALPGNPLLWLHRALVQAQPVTAVIETLVDLVLDAAPAGTMDTHADATSNASVQPCLQQLWVGGMGVSLRGLLTRRDPAMTAAVVRLLRWIATRTPPKSVSRRALLSSPSVSLVADVLAGVAESAEVRSELQTKKAVRGVVEDACGLVCALTRDELTSVFTDSLVDTTSTLISAGTEHPLLLQHGLRALAHLAAAFPMAASMALDFDFVAQQCAEAAAPAAGVGALVVGSLDVMSAVVSQQPAAVTFEWIEILLAVLERLEGWRAAVPGLDVALWRCARRTVEASEDCHEYLLAGETQAALCGELKRTQHDEAHRRDVLSALLAIAACMSPVDAAAAHEAAHETLLCVPPSQWTLDMCSAALSFLAATCAPEETGAMDPSRSRRVAAAAAAVLNGAESSRVHLPASTIDTFVGLLAKRGDTAVTAVVSALFDLAGAAADEPADQPEASAGLRGAALPLLHRLLVACPAARTAATAEQAERLLATVAAAAPSHPGAPALLQAALCLVEDTCHSRPGAGDAVDDDAEAQRVWGTLTALAQGACERGAEEEAWRAVLGRVCATAHVVFLAGAAVPIAAEHDPRVRFVGTCSLPHPSIEESAALLQTVLHHDSARASLRRDYGDAYAAALHHLTDPAHHASGAVPLSLQRYLDEVK